MVIPPRSAGNGQFTPTSISAQPTANSGPSSTANLGGMKVEVGSPKDVKSSVSSHPPEVIDSKSPPSVTFRSVAAAEAHALTLKVPEKLPLPSEIPSVPLHLTKLLGENQDFEVPADPEDLLANDPGTTAWREATPFGLSIPEGDPASQGAWLLSVALGTFNETQAIHLCMQAVDEVFKSNGEHAAAPPMKVLKDLLEGLKSAEELPRKEEGVREGNDAKARLELVRLAVTCRAGRYLGVEDVFDAHQRTLEFYKRDAPPRRGVELRVEAGLRFTAGHYRTALMVDAPPEQKVAKMLIVAMNQFDSPKSAHAAVIEQIERFAEHRKAINLTNPESGKLENPMSLETIKAERAALLSCAIAAIKRAEQSTGAVVQ